jgi:hypothetical protein
MRSRATKAASRVAIGVSSLEASAAGMIASPDRAGREASAKKGPIWRIMAASKGAA